jgi:GT2 family glycosyltransferase
VDCGHCRLSALRRRGTLPSGLSTEGRSEADAPPVSVVVPVYNGGAAFRRCLDSLASTRPPPIEVIVVGDGDTDGSSELAESLGMRVLRLAGPRGPARARNAGARVARGEIVFFVDADVCVRPDAIARVSGILGAPAAPDAMFGSYDDSPAEPNFLSQYKNLLHHYVHQTSREEASTFWGACGAIRRGAFLAAGGFDEGYVTPSIEDIDLGYRLTRSGLKIRLVKDLQVKHLKRWGVWSLVSTDFGRRALPWTRLILRDRRLVDDLNLRGVSRWSVGLAWIGLLALAWAVFKPASLGVAALSALGLLALNWPVYRFLGAKRGTAFALLAIPWHWLHYLYSGLAFALGIAEHLVRRS